MNAIDINKDGESGAHILNIYKKMGETPLECLNRLRLAFPEYKNAVLSYAGRLDPLAEGVLIVLAGDEANKLRKQYLDLSKEYTFGVLFGITTDTYDLLGLVENVSYVTAFDAKKFEVELKKSVGKNIQQYPPYSSKTVKGKPLFEWARENRLDEIEIPKNEIELYGVELLKIEEITAEQIEEKALSAVAMIRGDFRQAEIADAWKKKLKSVRVEIPKNDNTDSAKVVFPMARIRINCSSGTYARALANTLGKIMGIGAIAIDIKRTKVGTYIVEDSKMC